MSEEVQPENTEGQGDGDIGQFYDLSGVPEDYRPHLEPILKDVQKNVDGKFREHAEFKSQWEPYSELGINEYEPESIESLLRFASIIEDDDAFRSWWEAVGSEYGFMENYLDTLGEGESDELDDSLDEEGILDLSTMKQAIEEAVDTRLTPLLEASREQEQQKAVDAASAHIDSELERLHKEHGEFDEQAVYRFARAYDGPDAIENGVNDYLQLRQSIQKETISGNSTPQAVEGEGPTNTNISPITDFAEAGKAAKERLRQQQG